MLTGRSASVPPPGQRPMREDSAKRLRRCSEPPELSSTARSTLPPPPPPPQMQQPAAVMAMAAGGGAAAASPVAASPVAASPVAAAAAQVSPLSEKKNIAKKWIIAHLKKKSATYRSLEERARNLADEDITKDVFKQVSEEAVEQAHVPAQRTLTTHLIHGSNCGARLCR